MTSPVFTMRLDPELKSWLETEAKRKDRSASYLAKQAIQNMKNEAEARAEMVREAVAEAEEGFFISEEAMTQWFDSIGSENELPEPEPDVFPNKA